VSAPILESSPPLTLVVVTPKSAIDNSVSALRERFLIFAFLALAIVAILAWLLGRTIVRSLGELADAAGAVSRGQFGQRVPVRGRDELATLGRAFNEMSGQLAAERGRVQDAVDRFGKALAATNNPFALNVITRERGRATGAAGGRLSSTEKQQARAGDPDEGGRPLVIPPAPRAARTRCSSSLRRARISATVRELRSGSARRRPSPRERAAAPAARQASTAVNRARQPPRVRGLAREEISRAGAGGSPRSFWPT
jgi:HAMP domain-containing protein